LPDHVNRRQTAKRVRQQFVYLHNRIVTSIDIGGIRERAAVKF
jgi:hypothetical protein